VRAWLTPAPDPAFDIKCADICAIYHAAATAALAGVSTVSLDEMTGVQALERCAPGLPRKHPPSTAGGSH
jgi:orotidine-5'-phosphate decarboxylase